MDYGEYRVIISGMRELYLRLSCQPSTYTACIDGKEVSSLIVDGDRILRLNLSAGQPTQFEVVST